MKSLPTWEAIKVKHAPLTALERFIYEHECVADTEWRAQLLSVLNEVESGIPQLQTDCDICSDCGDTVKLGFACEAYGADGEADCLCPSCIKRLIRESREPA